MNKEKFKEALFAKDRSVISNIEIFSDKVSNDIEYFILANFFQSFFKGQVYLAENFTQNLWKWLSVDKKNINMILGYEENSLRNIFPSCSNATNFIKGGSEHFLCERKHLTIEDNTFRTILSLLGKHTFEQERWADSKGFENKNWIMSKKTKSYIARIKPKSKDDLLKKIYHFKYQKNMDRDSNATLEAVKKGIQNPRDDFGCEIECGVTNINCNGDFNNYHFYEWVTHFDIKPNTFFSKSTNDMVAFKLAAYLNKIIQLGPGLFCYDCKSIMIPDWNYAKKFGAAYNVTVFYCNNSICSQLNEKVYLNHCLNFNNCENLIDSRINKQRCDNGLLVCNHSWAKYKSYYKDYMGSCSHCCLKHQKI